MSIQNFKSCPPPEPPVGQKGHWELQYCNLNGWVWVNRDTKNCEVISRPPSLRQKKKKRFCGCFRKKPQHEPVVIMSSKSPRESKCEIRSVSSIHRNRVDDNYPCCCNDFNDLCPCMLVCCPCNVDSEKCPCKNATTQTHTELKDTSTVMSKVQIPKPKTICPCKCRGKRVMCVRAVCCPCAQNTCCPCVQNPNQNTDEQNPKSASNGREVSMSDNKNVDNIINLCLTSNLCKPNLNSFMNHKSTDYSALQKSLDILLKNNTNILSLINENKELKKESRTPNFLDLSQSISCLSLNNQVPKSDTEHCKLLTAVCDAILSSHKFENEGIESRKDPSSVSMGQASVNSSNPERSFDGLNFSHSTNLKKETGVQVNDSLRKTKILNKTLKTRNRTPTVPRMFKKSVRWVNLTTQNLECRGHTSNSQNLEEILASNNFDFSNTTLNDRPIQDRQNILENTSPPFADYSSSAQKSYFRENK